MLNGFDSWPLPQSLSSLSEVQAQNDQDKNLNTNENLNTQDDSYLLLESNMN